MAVILAINSGSSSVKISVYKSAAQGHPPIQLADAQISGLTDPPASLTYECGSHKIKGQGVKDISSNEDACQHILEQFVNDKDLAEISSKNDITHACHRVVHGGDYPAAHVIDENTYHHLEELTDLAPLHNASALAIIRICTKALPIAKNIAYFDSSFHATIPEPIRTYPIDPEIAEKNRLRKYGFHGISYAFIVRSVAEYLHKPEMETSIIALHLGSGASACAIQNGSSLDNSMGLTPLAGLPGATRSGDIDPSLIFHFTHDAGKPSRSSTKEMHISTVGHARYQKSPFRFPNNMTGRGDIEQKVRLESIDRHNRFWQDLSIHEPPMQACFRNFC